MQIAFAASECTPYAKTGGLADVVGALPRELVKLGHTLSVYLPFYARVRPHISGEPQYLVRSLTIPFRFYNRFVGIVEGGRRNGVQYYFIDCPELFDRKELYGVAGADYPDNGERFGLFCRAVVEASKLLGVPDIFHVHDWQAALIPVYLRTLYAADPALVSAASVLTIHNAAFQGRFPPTTTEQLIFPWDIFTMDKLEQYDRFNFLKGGVVYSDLLTTVSRKYAEEIQTAEFGEQLEGVLRKRTASLRGILNGVDMGSGIRPPTVILLPISLPRISMASVPAAAIFFMPLGWTRLRIPHPSLASYRDWPRKKASPLWRRLWKSWRSAIWPWWRWAPAILTTKIFCAAGLSDIPLPWP